MNKKAEKETETELALIAQDVAYIKADVSLIKTQLNSNYATKEWVNSEYGQTKKILNSILITIGLAIVGAFATFITRGGLK